MNKRGVITLVFDDGYQEILDHVIPLLDYYGIEGVFAVPTSNTNLESWKRACANKHEFAGHGITHKNLTMMPDNILKEELEVPVRELYATSIVYPGGAYNDEVMNIAKKYYTAGRTVMFGLETIPPKNPYELHTINYTKKNFSLLRANMYALVACIQNKWLIETFHMVSPTISDQKHFVYLQDLEAHLDFITSLPIDVKTIRNTIKSYA